MIMSKQRNKPLLVVSAIILLCGNQAGFAEGNTVVTQWNDAALQAIRTIKPGPPVAARALAVVHTCMYDAWAAYDNTAIGTRLAGKLRRPVAERTEANKTLAIHYAAYRCLSDLFPSQVASFNDVMLRLDLDPKNKTFSLTTPIGIGNYAAKAVLNFRHYDGSNQLGNLHKGAYSDYTGYQPVNTPTLITDPNHWQPLRDPVTGIVQKFSAAHWNKVVPFALTAGDQFRSQLKAPADYYKEPERYKYQVQQILNYNVMLDHKKKVIAEYWADGPNTEFPPGHWTLFAEYVSDRDKHTLDQDVKMFFAMTNAVFDVGIAIWDAKRAFDYIRPVSAVHFLFAGKSVKYWGGTVDGADWKPYQAGNGLTPPFPEYVSGHSGYSAAAAEILKLFTKQDTFGYSTVVQAVDSRNNVTLSWPTFTDAANEAGMSRRYGGIHFVDGDLQARKLGRLIGQQAWKKAQKLFNGQV